MQGIIIACGHIDARRCDYLLHVQYLLSMHSRDTCGCSYIPNENWRICNASRDGLVMRPGYQARRISRLMTDVRVPSLRSFF